MLGIMFRFSGAQLFFIVEFVLCVFQQSNLSTVLLLFLSLLRMYRPNDDVSMVVV
jgi:hypothetical protein